MMPTKYYHDIKKFLSCFIIACFQISTFHDIISLIFRGHARALRAVANEYVDAVLGEVHSYIEDNQLTELAIPDIEASFSKEVN